MRSIKNYITKIWRRTTGSGGVAIADRTASSNSFWARYRACGLLTAHSVQNIIWFEDVLVFYGSDTAVFDLYILVPAPVTAAKVLGGAGFRTAKQESLFPNDERSCRGGIRLEDTSEGNGDGVVLISAADWLYDLKQEPNSSPVPLPPLSAFMNSLMGVWLRMPEDEYNEKHLHAMSLVNLINYCYNLPGSNGDLVRSAQFADQLRPEFRELHFDLVGKYPRKSGISSYRKHEYHALRCSQIKEGKFVPRPYPTTHCPPSLAEYGYLTGLDARGSLGGKRKGLDKVLDMTHLLIYFNSHCPRETLMLIGASFADY